MIGILHRRPLILTFPEYGAKSDEDLFDTELPGFQIVDFSLGRLVGGVCRPQSVDIGLEIFPPGPRDD